MSSLENVDIPLNPDLQAKLRRLAEQQGRASAALIVEAVERMVNYDEWFLREVDKGLAAADRGQLVDHADVRKLIDQRYPGMQIRWTDDAVRDFTQICDYIEEHRSAAAARRVALTIHKGVDLLAAFPE